jgi:hypothetical protein
VGLAVEDTLLDDLAELGGAQRLVARARGDGHRHVVGEHAHHQHGETVHVEGERGRGISLRELLGDQAVRLIVGAKAAMPGRDAQAEEPGGPQVGVVVEGEGRLTIVALRARCETLAGEALRRGDQFALAGGGLEIHDRPLL